MRLLSRIIFREIISGALLGTVLFTFVLFLQRVSQLFELLVRSTAPPETIGKLFLLVLPPALPFTVPVGVLVGVLIGLSRMSSDGEITAMRAAGISGRRVAWPVLTFAFIATLLTAGASLWLTPASIRETYRLLNELVAAQITAEVQPRVFEEQFPRTILYVGDVISGTTVRWRKIFMADLTPPEERKTGAREPSDLPRITVASEAVVVPDVARNRIQMMMIRGSAHEAGKDPAAYYNSEFPRGEQVLEAQRPGPIRASRAFREVDTPALFGEAKSSIEAAIELHQRFALPLACLLLALVGIPLGVSSRKAGKSAAFVITVFLAFLYWMGLISLIGLARRQTLPVPVAVWTPNAVLAVVGAVLMARLEHPGDRDIIGALRGWLEYQWRRFRRSFKPAVAPAINSGRGLKIPLLPQVVDTYILSSFLFYFVLLLTSFVMMAHVFNFFELLSDIIKNQIPMARVLRYHVFLTPRLIYDSTPLSVLVAVLVTFGVLTKQNEVIAFKACGISLYRLAIPVLLCSIVLSSGLFAFDHYIVPDANRIQDGLRNEIKGRPVQTWLDPNRKWIFSPPSRIYYYKYFDPAENVMAGVNVYELDQNSFQLRRHISAERARWEPSLKTWIFQNGWTRDIAGIKESGFRTYQAMTFAEVDEPPNYFLKEVKQDKQMNFLELQSYIQELQQSGFDTVRLQVQYHKKFSLPLFAAIMALISAPFSFMTGGKGALAGVGVSLGIAIAYYGVNQLFEQIGNVNQLPPEVAAWSPDALFSLAGLYLLARVRT